MLFNYLKPSDAIYAQRTFLLLKFIPLAMIVFFGLLNPILIKVFSITPTTHTSTTSSGTGATTGFLIWTILSVAPGIMLAFDGFLNTSFYFKKTVEPKKNIPKISLMVVLLLSVVYCYITLAQAVNKTGMFYDIFDNAIYGTFFGTFLKIIAYFLVFVSAIGLINGYSTTAQPLIHQAIDNNLFSFCQYFKTRSGSKKQQVFYFGVSITAFGAALMLIFCLSQNSDAALDGFTNIPVIILFTCYGILPIVYSYRLYKEKAALTTTNILIYTCSMISFFGGSTIALYQLVDIIILKNVSFAGGIQGTGNTNFTGGYEPLGATKNFNIKNFAASLLMIIGFTILFAGHGLDEKIKSQQVTAALDSEVPYDSEPQSETVQLGLQQ